MRVKLVRYGNDMAPVVDKSVLEGIGAAEDTVFEV